MYVKPSIQSREKRLTRKCKCWIIEKAKGGVKRCNRFEMFDVFCKLRHATRDSVVMSRSIFTGSWQCQWRSTKLGGKLLLESSKQAKHLRPYGCCYGLFRNLSNKSIAHAAANLVMESNKFTIKFYETYNQCSLWKKSTSNCAQKLVMSPFTRQNQQIAMWRCWFKLTNKKMYRRLRQNYNRTFITFALKLCHERCIPTIYCARMEWL